MHYWFFSLFDPNIHSSFLLLISLIRQSMIIVSLHAPLLLLTPLRHQYAFINPWYLVLSIPLINQLDSLEEHQPYNNVLYGLLLGLTVSTCGIQLGEPLMVSLILVIRRPKEEMNPPGSDMLGRILQLRHSSGHLYLAYLDATLPGKARSCQVLHT